MTSIFKEVESDLIGVEHTPKKVLTAPHRAEDLTRGEGGVEEDTNLGHGDAAGEEAGEDEKVEAMNPDEIALVEALDDGVGKLAVDSRVGRPKGGFAAGIAVDGTGRHVVHGVLRKRIGGYRAGLLLPVVVAAVGTGGRSAAGLTMTGVDRRYVVQDGPQHTLAKAIVPVKRGFHVKECIGIERKE